MYIPSTVFIAQKLRHRFPPASSLRLQLVRSRTFVPAEGKNVTVGGNITSILPRRCTCKKDRYTRMYIGIFAKESGVNVLHIYT